MSRARAKKIWASFQWNLEINSMNSGNCPLRMNKWISTFFQDLRTYSLLKNAWTKSQSHPTENMWIHLLRFVHQQCLSPLDIGQYSLWEFIIATTRSGKTFLFLTTSDMHETTTLTTKSCCVLDISHLQRSKMKLGLCRRARKTQLSGPTLRYLANSTSS